MSNLAPFASFVAGANTSVQEHLTNAEASYQGGPAFGVLFDHAAADPFGDAYDGAAMQVSYSIHHTPGIAQGDVLLLDGVPHVVTGQVQPDFSGWVVLTVYPKEGP